MSQQYALGTSDFIRIIERLRDIFQAQQAYLSELDSSIGDGDHGFSMAKGFTQFAARLESYAELSIGDLLKRGGFELVKTIGGAAGAIFGTMFTGQATFYEQNLQDQETLELVDLTGMWNEALNQIKKIGKAEPGDKTMIDALEPAVGALKDAAKAGLPLQQAFTNAALAAKAGAESTQSMIGKRGRAKYLGERGIGHLDAGAISTYLIFKAYEEYLSGRSD